MNYELAKELKDAGFPQTGDYGYSADGQDQYNYHRSIPELDHIRKPTLSELIEACGDGFFRLSHSENNDGTEWDAESWESGEIETGTTPEEAVARLWLALNNV